MRTLLLTVVLLSSFTAIAGAEITVQHGRSGRSVARAAYYSGRSNYYGGVPVRGYYRSSGAYVQPHYRSSPDGNFYNNWSSQGNYNPYTGQQGYRTYQYQYRYYGR